MRQRGGWLPVVFTGGGVALVTVAFLALALRYFGEGMLDARPLTFPYPVALGVLVLGSVLLWLSRR